MPEYPDRSELERIKARKKKEDEIMVLVKEVSDDSKVFEKIVNNLVYEYTADMDLFSQKVSMLLTDIKKGKIKKYSELRLEMKCLELANAMYTATDGLAVLGSQSDVAKTNREEALARAYANTKDGTIMDKKAEAAQLVLQEALIEKIIQRAYQIIVQKVKSANRMLEAIKKIITSRMIHKEVFRKDNTDMLDDPEENTLEDEGDDEL
jgi:hypothetical protein